MRRQPVPKLVVSQLVPFRLAALLLLAVFAVSPLHARPGQHRDAREQILALENQWRQAQTAGDLPAMEKLLSDDFIGITVSGEVVTKAQQLDRMRNHELMITRFQMSDTKIKLIAGGQVAIVNSLAQVEGTADTHTINGSFRYTRVYQRLPNGAWKITSFEATRVPGSGRFGSPASAKGPAAATP